MDARKRWWRAIIISMTLNVFLLCGVGILSAGMFRIEPVEQMLELDLVSDDSSQRPVYSSQGQASTSTSTVATQMVVPRSMASSTPMAVVQTVTTLSVDSVADNAIGETQAISSPISGSTSGSSNVSGGVQSSNSSGNGGQGSKKPSGGIVGPQILSQVQPTYPEAARQASITGTVVLKVQILEDGCAGDVSVKQSSGNELLDDSAVAAVYKWRFTPAKEKNTGRAVVCYTTVPVVFRLN